MSIEELRSLALSLPGVTEDIKWGHDLCFLIGEKMFLVLGPDNVPVTASFKTTDELFAELITDERFVPAPYLARNKWVLAKNIATLSKKEWQDHVRRSYDLIFSKLPKKLQMSIGGS